MTIWLIILGLAALIMLLALAAVRVVGRARDRYHAPHGRDVFVACGRCGHMFPEHESRRGYPVQHACDGDEGAR